jgi:MFS family permease
MCLGPALLAIGGIGAALATDFTMLLVWRFVQGVGSGIYMTVSGTVLVQISRPGQRGRVMAMYQASLLLGGGIGPAIGGFLAEHFGYAAPFWGVAAVASVALAVALFTFDEPPPAFAPPPKDGEEPANPAKMASLLSNLPFVFLCVITFGVFFTRTASNWVLVPLVGHEGFGLSVDVIGLALSITALANFAMLPIIGPAIDRFGSRPITIIATILTGIALAIIGLASGPLWFWVAIVILGIGGGFSGPSVGAALAEAIPPNLYGPGMGAQRMVGDAAFILGPLVVGFLSDIPGVGNTGGLLANALLMIAAGAVFAFGTRMRRV